MIGIDTSFLVAFEDGHHNLHGAARETARQYASEGFAVAPQVLTEFIHVVTDPRRFEYPLSAAEAVSRTRRWWDSGETRHVVPGDRAVDLFTEWMVGLSRTRKQVLDTMLAATYKAAGVALIATTDFRDFTVYPGIHPIVIS